MVLQAPSVTKTTTNRDADSDFGVIKKTTDYGRFMYMGGNRQVDLKHVKELQSQMERSPQMFASMPILVNENWYIVDGQHRFEAAKALRLPVYYIRQEGVGLADARQLNIAQKRWGIADFAQSYADSGRVDYIELLRINHAYPKIPLSMTASYLAAHRGDGGMSARFRRGEYQIMDKEDGIENLDLLSEVITIVGRPAHQSFAAALWKIAHHEDFDKTRFLTKLREKPDALDMATSTRVNLRNIEEVFNRSNKIQTRLY